MFPSWGHTRHSLPRSYRRGNLHPPSTSRACLWSAGGGWSVRRKPRQVRRRHAQLKRSFPQQQLSKQEVRRGRAWCHKLKWKNFIFDLLTLGPPKHAGGIASLLLSSDKSLLSFIFVSIMPRFTPDNSFFLPDFIMHTHTHTNTHALRPLSASPVSECVSRFSGKLQLFQQSLSRNPIPKWILSANHNYFVHARFKWAPPLGGRRHFSIHKCITAAGSLTYCWLREGRLTDMTTFKWNFFFCVHPYHNNNVMGPIFATPPARLSLR